MMENTVNYKSSIYNNLFLIICLALCTQSCINKKDSDKIIYVSLLPQQYLVKEITGNLLDVRCLVPKGIMPETYDPSAREIHNLYKSKLLFISGLFQFEKQITKVIYENSSKLPVIPLSEGIEGISDSTHLHCGHSHEIDPHTWCSPKQMKISAQIALRSLKKYYPQYADSFNINYNKLNAEIDRLDDLAQHLLQNNKRTRFLIYHPTLTYLARDYKLEQIAIELDGKEPSLKYTQSIINLAKQDNLKYLFVQKEYDLSLVRNISDEFGGKIVVINPLNQNWAEEMELTIRSLNKALNE